MRSILFPLCRWPIRTGRPQRTIRFPTVFPVARSVPLDYNEYMDTYTTIKSLRAVRQYTTEPIAEEQIQRMLQAARWAGSSKNNQPWSFVVIKDPQTLALLSKCGNYAGHLRQAPLAIAVVTGPAARADFDSGRACENMMLAAWGEGIGSCVTSMHDEAKAKQVLGIPDSLKLQQVITFGHPRPETQATIEGKPLRSVLASTGRRPLAEMVHKEKW